MHTENRLRLLSSERTLRRQHAATASAPHAEPRAGGAPVESNLLHLLDLRARYLAEEVHMRNNLCAVQAALEDRSRKLWHHLAAGQASPASLRERCDALVVQVEHAERELADVRMAIQGVGEEIAALLAVRAAR